MTPEMAKRWLPIIQAIADGETIQTIYMGVGRETKVGKWIDCQAANIDFNWCPDGLRIKPTPREFWIATHSKIAWEVYSAPEVARGNRFGSPVIHVREVIDE